MKYVSWGEKNRPNNLDEICYQEDVKIGLKNFVKKDDDCNPIYKAPVGSSKWKDDKGQKNLF